MASASVQALLNAEKDAAQLVERAKQERSKKIRSAQADAQKEVKEFLDKYDGMTRELNTGADDQALQRKIDQEAIAEVQRLQTHAAGKKNEVVSALVRAVVSVE
jgi:V-type H+-transporting ATPase subunit G